MVSAVKQLKPPEIRRFGTIVTVNFFDRMLDAQTRRLSRMLGRAIAEAGGSVRLLLSVASVIPSGSPEALFDSLQFLKIHAEHIDRIAIVGYNPTQRTYVGLFSLFSGIEIEYFEAAETSDAVRWLQGQTLKLR
ncbi:hypothetical protein D3OALGA1CA_2850 [Olavius algarvensis associated proteobacterium Delta 3]|nr:hypothetical protein D3OALGA1CA_2850 [Olavius algarvensis associated proteobacterium Delta 3]CAB5163325.1 hypothetical protein D3OALGB2SA_5573 [Olavius algarvensis associated proteobacterium Delta 3]